MMRCNRYSPSCRCGYLLFEVLFVVSVAALIGTIATQLIHVILQQQTAMSVQLATSIRVARMNELFVKDVQSAVDAERAPRSLMLLRADDVRMEWNITDDAILRTLHNGQTRHPERFDLPPDVEATFGRRVLDGSTITLMSLELRPSDRQTDLRFPDRSLVASSCVAELSRDYRWSQVVVEQSATLEASRSPDAEP